MNKHGSISYNKDDNTKCEMCITSQIDKKTFSQTERNPQVLGLIRYDIYEFNRFFTREDKCHL